MISTTKAIFVLPLGGERAPPGPNSGPQAPESSRTQDQSNASGHFFFEYLVVVSLKKRRDQEGYEPQITYQFPKVRLRLETQHRRV